MVKSIQKVEFTSDSDIAFAHKEVIDSFIDFAATKLLNGAELPYGSEYCSDSNDWVSAIEFGNKRYWAQGKKFAREFHEYVTMWCECIALYFSREYGMKYIPRKEKGNMRYSIIRPKYGQSIATSDFNADIKNALAECENIYNERQESIRESDAFVEAEVTSLFG